MTRGGGNRDDWRAFWSMVRRHPKISIGIAVAVVAIWIIGVAANGSPDSSPTADTVTPTPTQTAVSSPASPTPSATVILTAHQRRFLRDMRALGSGEPAQVLLTEATDICRIRREGNGQGFAAAGVSGGRAEARAAEKNLCPRYYVAPAPRPAPTAPPPPPPSQAPAPTGCYPKTDGGNCYQPGEFCRASDHGASGIDANGDPITCEDNDGWRWEPA
jgi:hypothetical protein